MLKGAYALVLDDICDTGKTLALFAEKLKQMGAKEVKLSTLIVRPDKEHATKIDFVGLPCSQFIVGYGLDYNQLGRQYPEIYQKIDD